jgi:hypothetical protein
MWMSRRRGWTDEELSWDLVDIAHDVGNMLTEKLAGFGVCEEIEGKQRGAIA